MPVDVLLMKFFNPDLALRVEGKHLVGDRVYLALKNVKGGTPAK